MSIPTEQWNEALKAIFAKATTDAAFRETCLTNPIAAIKEASGLEVPADSDVTFTETKDGSGITLPAFGADPDEILDAEILDGVAGGGSTSGNCGSSMCRSIQWCG